MSLNFVLDFDENTNYSDNHHIRATLSYLIENYNYIKIKFGDIVKNINTITNYFKQYGDYEIIKILSFGGVADFEEIIDKIPPNIHLGFIVVDIHHGKSINKPRRKVFQASKYLFLTYAYHFEMYFPKHPNLYLLPHSICYKVHFNDNPIPKILISGHLKTSIYPNRDLMVQHSKIDDRLVLFKPDFTGYRINVEKDSNKTFGVKYYELLNKYLVCVVDDLIPQRRYIVAKFFEILGSGALLLAFNKNTIDVFTKLGYIDGVHYLTVDSEKIKETVDYVLDPKNLNIINTIRRNGYEFTHAYHTYVQRANYIHNVMNYGLKPNISIDTITKTTYFDYVVK